MKAVKRISCRTVSFFSFLFLCIVQFCICQWGGRGAALSSLLVVFSALSSDKVPITHGLDDMGNLALLLYQVAAGELAQSMFCRKIDGFCHLFHIFGVFSRAQAHGGVSRP